ncbi:sarcosine oxidase subunit gamma [Mesorhizobium sp. VK9D]|uniref:sarcosine oxidase subunit gamma n=1 Tax=Mesorhizobium australafricanum TaxID=3072311 RepID=UPI002A24D8E8|nr:sarcosine oxidase subunit gamma [Mesorhizobium sp. VK9D]MDX8455292.1 sarcosine oxidase subunit gamma [Mesorhizobium sp. VK9D]
MADLKTVTALGAATPHLVSFGPLEVRENHDQAIASLALRRGASRPVPYGLDLPGPGSYLSADGVFALWTGPGQWMLGAKGRAAEDFEADLKQMAPDCSVTEQTDGWITFEIASRAGPNPIHALLSKLVNIDLADFAVGSAMRTGLEHLSCFVIRRSETNIAVLGARSSARSLWHALETAAKRVKPR